MEGLDIPFRYITQVADIIIFSQAFAPNGLAYHQEGLKCGVVVYNTLFYAQITEKGVTMTHGC